MLKNVNARKQLERQLRWHLAEMEKFYMDEAIVKHHSEQVDIVLGRIERYNKTVEKRDKIDPNVILKIAGGIASFLLLYEIEKEHGITTKNVFTLIDRIRP